MTSSGAVSTRLTNYPSSPAVKDPIFFYCGETTANNGELSASRPGGSGIYDFEWYMWNSGTGTFSIPMKTEAGVETSQLTGLSGGGYKVDIFKSGVYDTTLTGWLFFDQLPFASASLLDQKCSRIALMGVATPAIDTFFYSDPFTGTEAFIKNETAFLWSSEPQSLIPFPSFDLIKIIDTPPLEDVTYKLTVNTLGCLDDSAFFYESIHVKAEFTADPQDGEAPLEVSFTDKSVRGSVYTWDFGDDSTSIQRDPPPHTYYRPGEYKVKLIIESDLHCIDSMIFEKIVVDPSELKIPNVFTPDGDGNNDYFVVESKSLRNINVEIFSKSGLKVYSFYGEGETLREWQGWDGNVNRTSTRAAPGVYYYIIRARGWDDKIYNSKEQRGFFYLYR